MGELVLLVLWVEAVGALVIVMRVTLYLAVICTTFLLFAGAEAIRRRWEDAARRRRNRRASHRRQYMPGGLDR